MKHHHHQHHQQLFLPLTFLSQVILIVRGSNIELKNSAHPMYPFWNARIARRIREGIKKNQLFLGKSPKLWVGGGQES